MPDAGQGLSDAWDVFDTAAAKPVPASLTELISAKDMAGAIKARRSQFNLLVEDRVLVPELEATDVNAVWHPPQAQSFLDSILTGAQKLRQAQHDCEHISKA